MSVELVGLALLMGLVTYPSRALPLLAPGVERLPPLAFEYLRLVGPAVLAALAAVSVMVFTENDRLVFHIGIEWIAVAVCAALTAWRGNLFLGLVGAVLIVGLARAIGLVPLP